MASIADPVTIERAYFHTLVRRANFNDGDFEVLSAALGEQNFTVVSKTEYANLTLVARQLATLRTNLLASGVAEETIALLSQDDTTLPNKQMTSQSTEPSVYNQGNCNAELVDTLQKVKYSWGSDPYLNSAQPHGHRGFGGSLGDKSRNNTTEWAEMNDEDHLGEYINNHHTPGTHQNARFGHFGQSQQFTRPHYPRMCKRTIVLAGIPDNTTYEDVTKVVRGGMLLEIYIKTAEHSALVSFLHEDDAVRFFEHSRKHDLYINHKRVFIKWADRHFHLAAHVAGQIAQGATRNMIIRRCDPNHTEESLRDDLEHIHNLVVISVAFVGGSCYIKTNSVHNAMFARTCMMSRTKYKGSKIEWDLDECEQSFETAPRTSPPKPQCATVTRKPAVKIRNRFATLRLDDDDNESDDRFDTSSDFTVPSTVAISA